MKLHDELLTVKLAMIFKITEAVKEYQRETWVAVKDIIVTTHYAGDVLDPELVTIDVKCGDF